MRFLPAVEMTLLYLAQIKLCISTVQGLTSLALEGYNCTMATIHELSRSMINKIAAGEVIERPSSVVKELVENAIDAGATRIDVVVERGGTELIRIVDNGCGIAPDQLTLALSPHATSKLADADDLFRIRTFGFRGEALASIAEISQMTLRSRTVGNTEGAEIRSEGGTLSGPVVCGMAVGTQIEVRNLFFNTPVRRHYMKTTTTEFGHVAETMIRLALPHPAIHFTLKHDNRLVHDLPPETEQLGRIDKLFGGEVAKHLLYVKSRPAGEIQVHGFVSHPNQSRANSRMQYFFLNQRYIRDKALQHALTEAYRGILTVGRFPMAFLEIEMSPELFDVNVHPTKMEVRFLDANQVYSGFLGAIRDKFLSTDLHGRPNDAALRKGRSFAVDPNDPRSALSDAKTEEIRKAVLEFTARDEPFSELAASAPEAVTSGERRPISIPSIKPTSEALSLHRLPELPGEVKGVGYKGKSEGPTQSFPSQHPPPSTLHPSPRPVSASQGDVANFLQIHAKYLVLETADGLVIIDQHALHERILFESMKKSMESGRLDTQRLLVPVPVDLSPTEAACVLENLAFFEQLGLGVESFGGGTVLISSYPAVLDKTPPTEILLTLVETLLVSGKKMERNDLLEEMLHRMACKAAVKAGDQLRPDAIAELVALGGAEGNAHHCPHGRPSMIVFSCEELDKMFRR